MQSTISRVVYAQQGETIFCEHGHRIGTLAMDLFCGDKVLPDTLADLVPGISLASKQIAPRCPACGGRWGVGYRRRGEERSFGGLVFKDGLRLAGHQGEIRTFRKIPAIRPRF